MAQVCCPHCRTAFSVAAEQQGPLITCLHCRTQFAASSAQIQPADATPGPTATKAGDAIKELGTDVCDHSAATVDSPALRRELARFTGSALPDLTGLDVEELPPEAEVGELAVGVPKASLHLPASDKRKLIIGGYITSAVGLALLLVGTALGPLGGRRDEIPFFALSYGGIILVLGLLLVFGKRNPVQTYWVCPTGMIWRWGKRTGFCR